MNVAHMHRGFQEEGLRSAEKFVLLTLAWFENYHTRACWPTQQTIARVTGLSERTVRRALLSLEKKDIIGRKTFRVGQKKTRSYYEFLLVTRNERQLAVEPLFETEAKRNDSPLNGERDATPVHVAPVRNLSLQSRQARECSGVQAPVEKGAAPVGGSRIPSREPERVASAQPAPRMAGGTHVKVPKLRGSKSFTSHRDFYSYLDSFIASQGGGPLPFLWYADFNGDNESFGTYMEALARSGYKSSRVNGPGT